MTEIEEIAAAESALRTGEVYRALNITMGIHELREREAPFSAPPSVEFLRAVLSAWPAILSFLTPPQLSEFRVRAAMRELGLEKEYRWADPPLPGSHLDKQACYRMISFAARHLLTMRELRDVAEAGGVREVELHVNNDGCPTCLARRGSRFEVDACPEIPFSDCTEKRGCRCLVTVSFNPPERKILRDLPDGRKVYLDRRRGGLTIGIGAEDPKLDDLVNLPDTDDGKEN